MGSNINALLIVLISILAVGLSITAIGFLTDLVSFLSPSVEVFSMSSGSLQEMQLNYAIGKVELETGLPLSGISSALLAGFLISKRKGSA